MKLNYNFIFYYRRKRKLMSEDEVSVKAAIATF